MDSILGIGFPELIVVLLLAGLVMGPQRIRFVARNLGRYLARFQKTYRQFSRQLLAELDSLDDGEARAALQDLRDLQREVADLRREIGLVPRSLVQESREIVQEGKATLKDLSYQDLIKGNESDKGEEQPEKAEPIQKPELPRPIEVPGDVD
jgi:Sec-independent protein translocase protein TatA